MVNKNAENVLKKYLAASELVTHEENWVTLLSYEYIKLDAGIFTKCCQKPFSNGAYSWGYDAKNKFSWFFDQREGV